jgi:hypothetical protein
VTPASQENSSAHSPSKAPPGMSWEGEIDQCTAGSSMTTRQGLGVADSKEGLPSMLLQEHAGGVADADAEQAGETVVTDVIVTVAGGTVGQVDGDVVGLVGLDGPEDGGVVARQEQALEIFAAEEEQGLANDG